MTKENAIKETEAIETLTPELHESEDEKIRERLVEYFKGFYDGFSSRNNVNVHWEGLEVKNVIAYLEKQKAKERLDRMAPIYNDKESFESALEKAWKYYNESASRTVDSFEDDYIECVFSKGFREGFLYREKQKNKMTAEEYENSELFQLKLKTKYANGYQDGLVQKEQKLDDVKREWWNKGYFKGRKYAHIPAKELGLPSSWDFQQKQKPVEPSDDELQKHQDELYDFKVFAAKQAREHNISFVYAFEWHNFCAELLSYFNERQKSVEYIDKDKVYSIMTKLTILSYSQLIPINSNEFKRIQDITSEVRSLLDYPIKQKPSEWSDEDEKILNLAIEWAETMSGQFSFVDMNPTDFRKIIAWLKSLRPPQYCENCKLKRSVENWKPSEEQMEALKCAVEDVAKFSKRGGRQVELENEPYYSALHSLYCNLEKLM